MAFKAARVTLNSSTATALLALGSGAGQFPNIGGTASDPLPIQIQNIDGAITIYIGGPAVTAATGYPLAPGQVFTANLYGSSEIPYAIGASGGPIAAILAGRQ